jgi:hypothetical protein
MMRKTMYVLLTVCLLAMIPANVVLAQKPEPPEPLDIEESVGAPPLDMEDLPEGVQAAKDLRKSLTPEQLAAIREVLAQYRPEMQAIGDTLATSAMQATGMDVGETATAEPLAAAEPQRLGADLMARMQAVVGDIDAELATILDADQLALHQAAMAEPDGHPPLRTDVALLAGGVSPAETEGWTYNCFYSAAYSAYAKYYAYWGRVFAYYAYLDCGTSYCYNAYAWAYNGYWYIRYALDYAAPAHFGGYYTGMISNYSGYSYTFWAYYWAYYAEYYTYYAYIYAVYCYVYDCSWSGDAYDSYLYSYYSWIYSDITLSYAYPCYTNW